MFLRKKLKLNDNELSLALRLLDFHKIRDEEVYLQVLEKGLNNILENQMVSDKAKEIIVNILGKTFAYRFDRDVDSWFGIGFAASDKDDNDDDNGVCCEG